LLRPFVLERGVLDELVHRHELDGGDAERGEVLDDRGVGDGGIRAADLLGDLRVGHRQALDVGLVDDALVVLVARRPVVPPVEVGVDDDAEHGVRERVVGVALGGVREVVGEEGGIVDDLPVDRLGVGVEEELRGVAAVAARRLVGAVDAEAVALSGLHAGEIAVPDEAVDLGHGDALLGEGAVGGLVDETELDGLGDLGEDGEVDAASVVGRPQGVCRARPDLHCEPFSVGHVADASRSAG